MSHAFRLHRLALLLSIGAGVSLAQANARKEDPATAHEPAVAGLVLRLADGSVLRVPADAASRRVGDHQRTDTEGHRRIDPRRTPPRRRPSIFGPEKPGAIASVRG